MWKQIFEMAKRYSCWPKIRTIMKEESLHNHSIRISTRLAVLILATILLASGASALGLAQTRKTARATAVKPLTSQSDAIAKSRESCVQVLATDINSAGTGFFLDDQHVVTNFHVVALIERSENRVRFTPSNKIVVVLWDGTTIQARLISIPSETDRSPYDQDFAVLRLVEAPRIHIQSVPFPGQQEIPVVGSDVIFSGYPLDAGAMLTHKGYVSGFRGAGDVICLEAPVNKGNSGGAVLNSSGELIGIVTTREGGINQALQEHRKRIDVARSGSTGVTMRAEIMGVNIGDMTTELIDTIDTYISTGIGYAISSKFLKLYLSRYPNLLKK